jgi:GGDEF domain-containing protein
VTEENGLHSRHVLRQQPGRKITPKQTDLPQGAMVDERLEKWLHEPSWALLLLRLAQMDQILNIYGYMGASEILDLVGRLLIDTLDRLEISGFVGHFSEIEFVMVIPTNSQAIIKKHLQRRLLKTLGYLTDHQKKDAQAGVPTYFELYNIAHAAEIDSLDALKIKLDSLQVNL